MLMRSPRIPRTALLVCLIAAVHFCAHGEDDGSVELQASLDDVVDWAAPFDLTLQKIEETFAVDGYRSSPLYAFLDKGKSNLRMGRKPYSNVTVDLRAMKGGVRVEDAMVEFRGGTARYYSIELAGRPEQVMGACRDYMNGLTHGEGSLRFATAPSGSRVEFMTWESAAFVAVLSSSEKSPPRLGIARPDERHRLFVHDFGGELALLLDLDFLVDLPAAWRLSPDLLDARLTLPGLKEQVFFQWMTGDRSRARFATSPFSNVRVNLSLFAGRLPVEELVVDFEEDRIRQITVSVFNRGDAGAISVPEFEAVYKACGQALGQVLGVTPRRQSGNSSSAVKTVSWMWDAPQAVALMEYNDYEDRSAKARQPEFLRVKLAPPDNMDWNFGVTEIGARTTTVSRSSLKENVTRTESGDVFVGGVPMVDQGDKGYCVVASCQRLFEYFHIPCDQHEMALLVGTDAQRGTNSVIMEQALDKIDNRFKTRFKPLIHTQMDARERKRLDGARFAKFVQENVDEGLPLLWTLALGRFPEDPPLPGEGQTSGGHMRMIIGYNNARGEILFTDSWGAGHELKRMKLGDAFEATTGLYLMLPRTL